MDFYQLQSKWSDIITVTQDNLSLNIITEKIHVHESTVYRMRYNLRPSHFGFL